MLEARSLFVGIRVFQPACGSYLGRSDGTKISTGNLSLFGLFFFLSFFLFFFFFFFVSLPSIQHQLGTLSSVFSCIYFSLSFVSRYLDGCCEVDLDGNRKFLDYSEVRFSSLRFGGILICKASRGTFREFVSLSCRF